MTFSGSMEYRAKPLPFKGFGLLEGRVLKKVILYFMFFSLPFLQSQSIVNCDRKNEKALVREVYCLFALS